MVCSKKAVFKVGISLTRHTEEADGHRSQVSVRDESFLDQDSEGRLAGTGIWIHLVGLGFFWLQAMVGSLLRTVSTGPNKLVSKQCIFWSCSS